jgi:hypothetical protein
MERLNNTWRYHFFRTQGLVFHLGTNKFEHLPTETAVVGLDYRYITNKAHLNVANQPGQQQDFILSMDQT